VPIEAWETQKRRERRLAELRADSGITDTTIHNAFQRLTWDASAEARGFRGSADLSDDMSDRLSRALIAATERLPPKGRLLDVGCGTGTTVGFASRKNIINAGQIVGIDISPDMVAVATRKYPSSEFVAADFMTYGTVVDGGNAIEDGAVVKNQTFDSVLFCMSLHDLPDPVGAIERAVALVRKSEGRVVICHPRGASHVVMQNRKNPVMVPNSLPTKTELSDICAKIGGVVVSHPPADAGSTLDISEGYLAVLDIKA